MSLEPKQIAELRNLVSKLDKDTAIKAISRRKEEPKDKIQKKEQIVIINKCDIIKEKVDIIFVICAILADLEKSRKKNSADLAFKILPQYFITSKDKMTANTWEQTKLLWDLSPDILLKDLNEVKDATAQVVIEDNNSAIWQELAIWLYGLYQFTAKDVPLSEQKKYAANPKEFTFTTSSPDDKAVFTKTGITAFHIAKFYWQMADSIDKKLQKIQEGKSAMQSASQVEVPASLPSVVTTTTTTPTPTPTPAPGFTPASTATITTAMTMTTTTTPPLPQTTSTALSTVDNQANTVALARIDNISKTVSIQTETSQGIDTTTIRMPHDEKRQALLSRFMQMMNDSAELDTLERLMQQKPIPTTPLTITEHLKKKAEEYAQRRAKAGKTEDMDAKADEEIVRNLRDVIDRGFTPQEEEALQHQFGEAVAYIRRYAKKPKAYVFSQTNAPFAFKVAEQLDQESSAHLKMKLFLKIYDETISIYGNELLVACRDAIVFLCNRLTGNESKNIIGMMPKTTTRVGLSW